MSSPFRSCSWCKAAPAPFKCAACQTVFYCTQKCQAAHWNNARPAEKDRGDAGENGEAEPNLPHKLRCNFKPKGDISTAKAAEKPANNACNAVNSAETPLNHSAAGSAASEFIPDFPRVNRLCIDDFALSATHLGFGNFSRVFKARHRTNGKTYAIKEVEKAVVKRLQVRHPNIQKEIMQEKHVGLLLSQSRIVLDGLNETNRRIVTLGRQHIVNLHCTFQDTNALYYVYEHIGGGELWELCMDACGPILQQPRVPVPLSFDTAATVMRQLFHAMAFMHAMGIAHRDLKPENMLIDDRVSTGARLRITDFATCKDLICSTHNSNTDFGGTPDYMPPEAIDAKSSNGLPTDSRGDLWSAGAIAYQLSVGCPPFKSMSQYVTMEKALAHQSHEAALDGLANLDGLLFPPLYPPDAQSLVRSLLVRQPDLRLGCTGVIEGNGIVAGCCRPRDEGDITPATSPDTAISTGPVARLGARKLTAADLLPPQLPNIDFSAILNHPFLARSSLPTSETAKATTMEVSTAVDCILEYPNLDGGAALVSMVNLAKALAGLDKVVHLQSDEDTDSVIRTQVSRLGSQHILYLSHLLCLRRRLQVPRIRCILAHGSAAGHCTAYAAARCLRTLGWDPVHAQFTRIGEYSPRELLGWNFAPNMYSSQLELKQLVGCHSVDPAADESSVWGNPEVPNPRGGGSSADRANELGWRTINSPEFYADFKVAVLSSPQISEGTESVDQLRRWVTAVNKLTLKPRAVVITGFLTGEAAARGTEAACMRTCAEQVTTLMRVLSALDEAISVCLEGEECIDSQVALELASCNSPQWPHLQQIKSCAAWISGSRWVFSHTSSYDGLAPAPLADELEEGKDLHQAVDTFRKSLTEDTRWLHETLEHARVGALHTLLCHRDCAAATEDAIRKTSALSGARSILTSSGPCDAVITGDWHDVAPINDGRVIKIPSLRACATEPDIRVASIMVAQHEVRTLLEIFTP